MILLTLSDLLYPGNVLELRLGKMFELGSKNFFFKSITSVYEDEIENIYVLDKKAYKVYKLSKEGKLQLIFGNRGQGPGDFLNPHSLHVTPEGNIIVNDLKDYVSVFDKQGKFLKRKTTSPVRQKWENKTIFFLCFKRRFFYKPSR